MLIIIYVINNLMHHNLLSLYKLYLKLIYNFLLNVMTSQVHLIEIPEVNESNCPNEIQETEVVPEIKNATSMRESDNQSEFTQTKGLVITSSNIQLKKMTPQQTSQVLNSSVICAPESTKKDKEPTQQIEANVIKTKRQMIITTVRPQAIEYVSYREIDNYYFSQFLKHNSTKATQEKTLQSKCLSCLFYIYKLKHSLNADLLKEKDYVLFLSQIKYNHRDKYHYQIMQSISYYFNYRHEETTGGIQEPLTIFSLIQMLYLIDKRCSFLKENMEKFTNTIISKNYLFNLMKAIGDITIKMVTNDKLNIYFNQRKSVLEIVEAFCFGLLELAMIELNLTIDNRTNGDNKQIDDIMIGTIIEKLHKAANDFPSSVIWKYTIFKEQYPEEEDSVSLVWFSNND